MSMRKRLRKKMIYEGSYVAEVAVVLVEADEGWSPYLSLEDAKKLDEVRKALRNNELEKASQLADVYTLTPLKKDSSKFHGTPSQV